MIEERKGERLALVGLKESLRVLDEATREMNKALRAREAAILRADAIGIPKRRIAEELEVTPVRIHQIIRETRRREGR